MTTPQLRPLSVGEILDAAIKLTSRHWKTLFTISAIVLIPMAVLSFGISMAMDTDAITQLDEPDTGVIFAFFGGLVLTLVVSFLSSMLANAGATKAIADVYLGNEPDWAESLRYAGSRLGALIGNGLLSGLLLLFGFLLCILPGVFLWVVWALAVPAIIVERAGPVEALGRSQRLLKGRFWPAFGVLVLMAIVQGVVGFILQTAGGAVFAIDQGASLIAQSLLSTITGTAASIVTLPFAAAVVAVLYFDQRVRKEGFDLELLSRQMGNPQDFPSSPQQQTDSWTAPEPAIDENFEPPTTDQSIWTSPPSRPPSSTHPPTGSPAPPPPASPAPPPTFPPKPPISEDPWDGPPPPPPGS